MTTTPAMPERFTKKSVTIEAVQFTEALRDAIVLDGAPCPEGVKRGATTWRQKDRKVWRADFFIDTLEGRMNVEIGDWIIKGVKGEFYPCKPDIFEMTYDRATLQAQPAAAPLPPASPATKGYCNDERCCQNCFSGQGARLFPLPKQLAEVSDAEIGRLFDDSGLSGINWEGFDAGARAILALRPQAVPMTGKQARLLSREELAGCCGGCASNSAIETWMRRAIEKFCEVNGITAPAGGEKQA